MSQFSVRDVTILNLIRHAKRILPPHDDLKPISRHRFVRYPCSIICLNYGSTDLIGRMKQNICTFCLIMLYKKCIHLHIPIEPKNHALMSMKRSERRLTSFKDRFYACSKPMMSEFISCRKASATLRDRSSSSDCVCSLDLEWKQFQSTLGKWQVKSQTRLLGVKTE